MVEKNRAALIFNFSIILLLLKNITSKTMKRSRKSRAAMKKGHSKCATNNNFCVKTSNGARMAKEIIERISRNGGMPSFCGERLDDFY